MDGTSQSAPHVAGILLGCGESGLIADGKASGDPDFQADPIAKANKLYYILSLEHHTQRRAEKLRSQLL